MGKNHRFKPQGKHLSASKGEKDLGNILRIMYPNCVLYYEYPFSLFTNTDNNKLQADVYNKTLGIAYEFQGQHHIKPVFYGKDEEDIQAGLDAFKERQELDSLKKNLCDDADIKFIEIFYYEWDKLKTEEEKIKYLKDKL